MVRSTYGTNVITAEHLTATQSHQRCRRRCDRVDDTRLPRCCFRWYHANIICTIYAAHVARCWFSGTVAQHHRSSAPRCTITIGWCVAPATAPDPDTTANIHTIHSPFAPRPPGISSGYRRPAFGDRAPNPLNHVVSSGWCDSATSYITVSRPRYISRLWAKCCTTRQGKGARCPATTWRTQNLRPSRK